MAPAPLAFRVRRSPRARLVRIVVGPDGVLVVAPPRVPAARLEGAVAERRGWIEARLAALRSTLARHPGAPSLASASHLPFRGEAVPLELVRHQGARLRVELGERFVVEVPQSLLGPSLELALEGALTRFLKGRARAEAQARIAHHAARHDLMPKGLRIRGQQTLWGSCTADGWVSLNWRLVLAPPRVLDYVVVHELCHLRERHHRASFWQLVGHVMPGYEAERAWLRANGALLTLTRRDMA